MVLQEEEKNIRRRHGISVATLRSRRALACGQCANSLRLCSRGLTVKFHVSKLSTTMEPECQTIINTIQQLSPSELPPDWRTRWQDASEALWEALSVEEPAVPSATINVYILLLEDHSRFALARAVLPGFREPNSCTPHQQRILDGSQRVQQAMDNL